MMSLTARPGSFRFVRLVAAFAALATVACFQGNESSDNPLATPASESQPSGGSPRSTSPTPPSSKARSLEVIKTRIADRDRRRAGSPPSTPSPTPRADASLLPDGVVVAPSIGLMWTPQAVGAYSQEDASRYCRRLSIAGFDDWTLPTIDDLERAMGADVVVSIPDTARALWTRTLADNRGHVTLDLATNDRSWMDSGFAHVLCVRAIPHPPDTGS